MDLGKWLRDRKKSVVNQWQNSTVLDAVSANTQADKARRVQAGQPQQFQGNAVARGITNLVGANKMKDTSVQDAADDEAFRNDLKNIINLRTSGQITPGQAQAKAINVAPTGNTDYTKDVLNNQANRSGVGQAILPALGTFAKPFATGLSDIGTAVGTGVEAFTPFNGVGKNIADASKRQSQGIEDLYRASSFNGGQEGENRLVTGVSSGLGSLASSMAAGATGGLKSGVGMKLSTGGRQLLNPTTMSGLQFGLSAGAGQMRDATDNGKSAGQAFGTGLVAGGVEAGLEKVGLDKYLGAGGNFLRKTGTRMLTEGLQEGSQSLAQSLVSGTFKHVNPVDALKQAALEGGMGGLVGGIGGVGGDIALNLQQKQNAPKAPQQVKQEVVAKSPVLQQTGIPVTPGSLRERIQLAKDSVANKIAGNSLINNQVGAIGKDVRPSNNSNEFTGNDMADIWARQGTSPGDEDMLAILRNDKSPFRLREIKIKDIIAKDPWNGKEIMNPNIRGPQGAAGAPPIIDSDSVMDGVHRIAEAYKKNPEGTIKAYVSDNFVGRPDVPSRPMNPNFEVNKGVSVVGDNISGAARQSYESKRGQPKMSTGDNEVDAAIERDSVRNYLRSKPAVKGDATTGEGAQLPSKGMTQEQKQSLIDKARAKVDPLDSLKQEARPATGARSDYSPENLQANRQIRAKNASSITYADKKAIKPDELVTVYRAVPGKAKGGLTEGDWVTPNKEQARLLMKQSWVQDDTGAKIVTKKVKASELRYHADDAKGYVDDELLYVPKSDPLEALKQEARKYKSAEEFVKTYSNKNATDFKPGEPIGDVTRVRLDDLRPTETGNKGAIKNFDQKKAPPLKVDVFGGIRDGHNRYYAALESFEKDRANLVKNWNQQNLNRFVEKWGDENFPTIKVQTVNIPGLDQTKQLTDLYNQATLKDNQSGSVQIPKVLSNISERIRNSSLVKDDGGSVNNKKTAQERIDAKEGKTDLDTLKSNLDNNRKLVKQTDEKLSAEFRNKSKNMTEEQKQTLMKEYQGKFESSDAKKQQKSIEAAIKETTKSEVADTKTSSEVGRLVKESFSQNTADPKSTGYFIDLSPDNIKNVTPLKGINDYGDSMWIDTNAGISEVRIQDWSKSGQGFRVSNGNGNEIARFNTDAEARDFARKALTVENEAARQGKRVILSGSRVENRTPAPQITTQKSSSKTKSPKPLVQDLPSISTRIAESKQKVQTSQSPIPPQEIQSTDTSVVRSSNKASTTPNTANDTTGDALSAENFAKTFGGTVKQAEKTLSDTPRFDAATRTDKGKDANKLFESMKTDAKINQATKEAQASGKELNFYAKKDVNGRSVGIEQFDPKRHRIEAGFVVDEQQNILGNHIKVDANGIQVNVGGKVVNMDSILGNPLDWGSTSTTDKAKKGRYKLSETMNRNIDNNAPSKEIANKTKNFLWSNKVKAEADMRTELEAEYKALGDRIKRTNKAKPLGVSKTQYQDDIFAVLNGDKTDAEIKSAYKENTANAILDYKKETRTLYDSLLQRVNTERVKFGQPEIQARKDYITHLQELNGNKGFVAEVYGQMKNSFADEGMGKTRNGVPGDIAGRTENFKPISKYNPFLQRRTGTKSLRDPYMAVQEYLQPALYNIHMTESGARARAIETAFRTAEQIKNTEPRTVLDEAKKITDKYKSDSDNAKLITGFQEYANAIAGKTQRFDRQVVDSSDTAAKGLKGWQALQRTGGRATILGNVSSMLAQPLNQVVGLADAGPVTYMKGIASAVAGDPAIEKSAFIKARETEPTKAIRTKGEKVLDSGSIPLQKVELASVKLMWHTQYQKALSQGLKGQEAIQQADLGTERLAAGRGIADKPELYRSTVANGVLQYTLEVNAQNKAFWQDLSPKQKATFLVASTATNTLMGAITGFEPLPDFLKAMFETGKDILDGEDDQNIGQELVQGGQRMLDQYARMNPLLGAPVNLLPQAQRKAIFGQDSDTGRFSGSTAPVQVVTNAVKAASDVTKGNYKSARDNILRDVPFGNQIRKTLTGAEMINRGYAVDSSGKKTFDAPTSPLGKAQALAFGPSATKPAREYYDKGTSESSGKSVATKDAQGNETTKDDFESISKVAFNSPKGKEFMALKNEDERKEYARQSPDNRQIYDDYKAMQKAFNGGDKLLAPGLDETSAKTLNKYDRMTPKAKENIFNRNKSAEYEYELASYNNKKANGETNLVDEINGQQRLSKLRATKDFDKAYRDLYSGLSKTEVYDLITSNPDGKKIAEQLLAIDDALVKAGNKAKFRDKYGNVTFAPKSSSGGRGSRSAKSQSQSEVNNLTQDTLSKLNSLLAGAQKPVKGVKKVATAKPTLKKITVKK